MNKRILALLLAVALVLCSAAACAEGFSLQDLSEKARAAAEKKSGAVAPEDDATEPNEAVETVVAQPAGVFGPPVTMDDIFFTVERSTVYVEADKYSVEATVFAEVKNATAKTLYIDDCTVTMYNAAGEVVDEESYASIEPEVVAPGESAFLKEWFYNFSENAEDANYFVVEINASTDSYYTYAPAVVEAAVSDGVAYIVVNNPTEDVLFGAEVTAAISDEEGKILDVVNNSVGSSVGLAPGSSLLFCQQMDRYDENADLSSPACVVYAFSVTH